MRHSADAGHERGERPDDRYEPGQDDRLAAVPLEEGLGLGQVAWLEESGVGIGKGPRTEFAADPIIGRIAEHGRCEEGRQQRPGVKVAAAGQGAGREQQRVAGQERGYDQSGLRKDHQEQQRVAQGPELVDDLLQVGVDVEDEVEDAHGVCICIVPERAARSPAVD